MARAAQRAGIAKMVVVSTDKAVHPSSVMGATKRVVEMIAGVLNEQGPTKFVVVRFGNVLGSAASVVPIFKRQIAAGGPVTLTDPNVTRFFMSVPEASGLILQAGAVGGGGEIMLLDMGEPIRISILAETLITLSGLEPYKDIDIISTGLRPGEKLHETLADEGEIFEPTGYEKMVSTPIRWAGEGVAFLQTVEDLIQSVQGVAPQAVRDRLQNVVPTYQPMNIPAEKTGN